MLYTRNTHHSYLSFFYGNDGWLRDIWVDIDVCACVNLRISYIYESSLPLNTLGLPENKVTLAFKYDIVVKFRKFNIDITDIIIYTL